MEPLFNGVTLIASIGIAGYAQRKRIGSIAKKLGAATLAGPATAGVTGAEAAGSRKPAPLQGQAMPMPDRLHRAHDYVERMSRTMAAIRQAETDEAREQAWRAAMADEAIGAELRRLTRSGAHERPPQTLSGNSG